MVYQPIEDYAVIGDGRSAALVGKDGSIDWLCLPRFDSPSVFGAILDDALGGRFSIRPTAEYDVERRYLPDTCVLETTFRAETGTLRLTDCMAVVDDADSGHGLRPDHELIRVLECRDGGVEVEVHYDPRPGYGTRPTLRHDDVLGAMVCHERGASLALQSEVPLGIASDGAGARGTVRLQAGERRCLSLTSEKGPAVVSGLSEDLQNRIDETVAWWRDWCGHLDYDGPYRDHVVRSALTLKLLTFAPSGAIIAAPTTSLPERIGAAHNWDYRYCWIRDATMTLRALFDVGSVEEGESFLGWLLHTTRLTWPRLQVLYDVFGESDIEERLHLAWEGYRASSPVRFGNAASDQFQLDVYGELVAAVVDYVDRGGSLDRSEARMIRGLGDSICELWRRPDAGIWEFRGQNQQHTVAKVLSWVGLAGLVRLHDAGALKVDRDRYCRALDAMRETIETRGWNETLQSYTATLDGETVDASLLMLPLYGYIDADAPRMRSTADRIHETLGRDGLVYRFRGNEEVRDGGAFGICSFWWVDVLARRGEVDRAREAFEDLLKYTNDVGLLAEEIDPLTGAALGNTPQAFTHVGLINAAVSIAAAEGRDARSGRTPDDEEREEA